MDSIGLFKTNSWLLLRLSPHLCLPHANSCMVCAIFPANHCSHPPSPSSHTLGLIITATHVPLLPSTHLCPQMQEHQGYPPCLASNICTSINVLHTIDYVKIYSNLDWTPTPINVVCDPNSLSKFKAYDLDALNSDRILYRAESKSKNTWYRWDSLAISTFITLYLLRFRVRTDRS